VSTKEIVDTMKQDSTQQRPMRRFYSAELKAQVIQSCQQAGASVAGVAMSQQINPNTVHRWIREERQRALPGQLQHSPAAFVALELQRASVDEASGPALSSLEPQAGALAGIRIDIERPTGSVTVNWPLEGAASCAAWLREWLR
jgi:transposase